MNHALRYACLVLAVSSVSFGQEHLPTTADLDAAKRSQALATQLAPRVQKLSGQCQDFDAQAEKAGLLTEGTQYHLSTGEPPPQSEIGALEAKAEGLKTLAAAVKNDCQQWTTLRESIGVIGGVDEEITACKNWYASTGKRADCTVWKQLEAAAWPGDGTCFEPAERATEIVEEWKRFKILELKHARVASAQEKAVDGLYLQPVSGNARERAIVIPRKYYREEREVRRISVIVDTVGLFSTAHPSRFVFLRKNLAELPRDSLNDVPNRTSRTLKKGEAVLSLRRGTIGAREVEILSIDGIRGLVSLEDLAQTPLPGTHPGVLTAADLNVLDDKGNAVGGPTWLEPDSTGFSLDEPNGWLDLLDPQEPRTTNFLEARDRTLKCYQAQRARLDPNGTLSKYFDIVTFGRNGNIKKVESAAVKFDRTACAACGCKKFNDLKSSYIKAAIAPAQKKAFERYQPVVEQLSQVDFEGASKGAPRGVDDWAGRAL